MKIHRILAPALAAAVILSASALTTTVAQAAPTVTTLGSGATADGLTDFFIADGTPFSNVTVTGQNSQIGSFTGFTTLKPGSGVALSTGFVNGVPDDGIAPNGSALPGPNFLPATGGDANPGSSLRDLQLESLPSVIYTTDDAVSLAFDFVPKSNLLRIYYAFGSEEYTEYSALGTPFNDVFAFFLDGPAGSRRICGDIESVQNANQPGQFVDNPVGSNALDTGLDGVTTLQECNTTVTKGDTYHIRIVIADVYDDRYDSILLLQQNGFITAFPEAINDTATTLHDTPVTIPILTNDVNWLTIDSITNLPAHGKVEITPANELVYTPDPGYSGNDEFIYRITGLGGTDTATVSIKVLPSADHDLIEIPAGDPHGTVDVLENDNGHLLVVRDFTSPSNGTVEITADGHLKYTPNPGFTGDDEFTYTAHDHHGQAVTATVKVKVNPLVAPVVQQIKTGGTVVDSGFSPLVGLVLSFAIGVSAVALRRLRYA